MNTTDSYMIPLKPQYCKIDSVACLNILRKSIKFIIKTYNINSVCFVLCNAIESF